MHETDRNFFHYNRLYIYQNSSLQMKASLSIENCNVSSEELKSTQLEDIHNSQKTEVPQKNKMIPTSAPGTGCWVGLG